MVSNTVWTLTARVNDEDVLVAIFDAKPSDHEVIGAMDATFYRAKGFHEPQPTGYTEIRDIYRNVTHTDVVERALTKRRSEQLTKVTK